MTTKHTLTDAAWLERFENGEIDVDPAESLSLIDLMDIRAFELLRREVADAVLNSVRLARQRGITWIDIGSELSLTEPKAIASYRERIGTSAEAEGARLEPVAEDVVGIDFHVRHLATVEQRLREAIERIAGTDERLSRFVESYVSRSADDARQLWNRLD